MVKSLFSPSWYRVAGLTPRLRSHTEIHRQRFRGQVWYVLQDHQSGRFHRISPAAYLMICLMDGRRTLRQIWELANQRFADEPPSQDETIQLPAPLHNADLLLGDLPPDMAELAHRTDTQRRRDLLLRLRNPLAVRIPLLDPDRFLYVTAPLIRPLFSLLGFIAWLALVATGIVLAAMHWSELTSNIADRVLGLENIALILIAYPLIKALHELGHGYATKIWGGEVHEIGVMFLVLMPIPYVDASSSSAFREKWRRAAVGGAGIMVEMALAALALIAWINVEPGIVHAILFDVMLIGGVSTMLFNGNPLLRFDGYYVLSDLLEIPNLRTRSNKYLLYLVQHYLFGASETASPTSAPGERRWFVVYGFASFAYRLFIILAIALFVASKLFVLGVLLALWAVASMLVFPAGKSLHYLATSPQLRKRRGRAFAATGAFVAAVLSVLLLLPLPYATVAQGVLWVPEDAAVRARTEGLVREITAEPDRRVEAGQPLIALEDPILETRVELLEMRLREFELRLDAIKMVDLVQANVLREQIRHTQAALALDRQRMRDLTLHSPAAGRLVLLEAEDLPGRFVVKGQLLGYVVSEADPVIRVVVPQSGVDLVRQRTDRVDVRFATRLGEVTPARVIREAPAAIETLPAMSLGTLGGGDVLLDPKDPRGTRVLESLFQLDLGVAAGQRSAMIGARAYVRFDHGNEAIAWRLYRAVRQLFLSHFDV